MIPTHDVERAAQLAADLVNLGLAIAATDDPKVATPAGQDHDATTLADLLAPRGLPRDPAALAAAAPAVRDFARRARPAFTDPDPAPTVNALLAGLRVVPRLVAHDDRPPHLHFEAPDASPHERLIVNSILGLAGLLGDDPGRLGACVADGCETVFVDTSRNGRRRYCDRRCATRSHVAAHRAREKVARP